MTLTIQDLGALGELLGSVAVLVTLIYLAMQTRQNTMAISAQLEAATLSANQTSLLSAATSTELEEALAEDRTDDVTSHQVRRAAFWASVLISMQWQLHQGRGGLLPTFDEAAIADWIRGFFVDFRSFEDWWDRMKGTYRPEFVEFVEDQRAKAA